MAASDPQISQIYADYTNEKQRYKSVQPVMLSETLQRNARHEARLANISGQRFFASLRMTEPSRSLMRGRNSAHHSQIILIPRRGNTFASGVRPGFIGARGN